MSSRRNRLSLSSDLRKDASGKTSNGSRTPARTTKGSKTSDIRSNDESCEVSPSQGADSPVISLTQDTVFHAINGVSWDWNSPQRFNGQRKTKLDVKRSSHKTLLKLKNSEAPAAAPKQATGFNKFISKLNLLMGKENMSENVDHSESSSVSVDTIAETEFFIEEQQHYEEPSKDDDSDDDLFQQYCVDKSDDHSQELIDANEIHCEESNDAFDEKLIEQAVVDELDDSKLDRMLIEASQTVEHKLNQPPTVFSRKFQSNSLIPVEMNDSDMDGFLVQASLMVEVKQSDSSPDSTSYNSGPKDIVHQAVTDLPNQTTALTSAHPETEIEVGSRQPQPKPDLGREGDVACTSEITMSEEDLKALLEKKRQEALQRLQNNRIRRAMKGTNSNG